MCCHRHPLGGRNFESYSEDPFLAGKLAAQTVVGIESAGVSATLKHYAGNEQETQRLSVDEKIGQRALREIYLKPFEFAIKEGKPGAVMTAYNKINGEHCDSSEFLLTQILRKEWGWDGLTMTDWGGLNSTEQALKAGLDLEMPGPSRWRKVDDVLAALKVGKVTESVINDRALNVLRFLERQGCFEDPEIPAERAVNKPEHQALIREAGAKGMVLLKNEGDVLPLTKEKVKGKTIALLGYAKQALAHGGGSAAVNAHYTDTPFDGLTRAFEGSDVKLTYAKGKATQLVFKTRHSVAKWLVNRCSHFPATSSNVRKRRRHGWEPRIYSFDLRSRLIGVQGRYSWSQNGQVHSYRIDRRHSHPHIQTLRSRRHIHAY